MVEEIWPVITAIKTRYINAKTVLFLVRAGNEEFVNFQLKQNEVTHHHICISIT